jgi:hypothetical protein
MCPADCRGVGTTLIAVDAGGTLPYRRKTTIDPGPYAIWLDGEPVCLLVPEQARPIKRSEARQVMVQRYLDNVVAADRKRIAKVFPVLKWIARELG